VSFESEEKKVCIYFKCIFYVYFSSITHFCKAVKMVLCQLIKMYPPLKVLSLTNENYQKISLITCRNKAYARARSLSVFLSVGPSHNIFQI